MHRKPLLISIATLILCLVLLTSVFLSIPNSIQASAPNTPISVTQPSQCTPLQADANGVSTDYETCVVVVSIKKDYSKGVHFSVSYKGKSCFYNICSTSTSMSGVVVATPEGTSLTKAVYPARVMLIVPYYEQHGYITMTFTFHGPSNSTNVQMITNSCC